jgi:hypothetical protein
MADQLIEDRALNDNDKKYAQDPQKHVTSEVIAEINAKSVSSSLQTALIAVGYEVGMRWGLEEGLKRGFDWGWQEGVNETFKQLKKRGLLSTASGGAQAPKIEIHNHIPRAGNKKIKKTVDGYETFDSDG